MSEWREKWRFSNAPDDGLFPLSLQSVRLSNTIWVYIQEKKKII